MTYTDLFGNGVAVSRPSYLGVALVNTDAYEFNWPDAKYDTLTSLPSYIKILSPGVSGGRIMLPNGISGSVGIQVVISNNSTYSVSVLANDGSVINTLAVGQCFLYTLIGNSTQAGTWDYLTLGTVVSSYDATQLAGYGLKAVAGTILAAAEKVTVNASRTLQSSDRGKAVVWTGGAGTLTTADLSASGAGFFTHIYNGGTGNLALAPGAGNTMNGGASSVTLSPGQSAFLVEYSTEWYSLYNSTATGTGFTAANIACPGTGTKTLTTAELSAQIQNLTGTLTGNIILDYNSAVGLWFVTNKTSGAFTITLRANGSDTGLTIGSGATIIMKSDGVNMIYAVASGGTVTSVGSGTGLTGGPITGAGTLSIADTAVGAGTYGSATKSVSFTVNSKGQLTAAAEYNLDSTFATDADVTSQIATVNASIALKAPINNAVFTGTTTLAADPTSALHASTKQYVDQGVASFVNMIINGQCWVSQLNNGAVLNPVANGQYPIDRFPFSANIAGKWKSGRDLNAVTPPVGFSNYLGFQALSAYTPGSTEYNIFDQRIEGYNMASLAWGTANAYPVCISFWVYTSKTGTHSGSIRNAALNRCYPFTFTVTNANTWEYKTIIIPGDTSGTWAKDNTLGAYITFNLSSGSTLLGTAGAWAAASYVGATGAVNVGDTVNATFYITGIQVARLETLTSQPLPFQRRSLQEEISLCERYIEVSPVNCWMDNATGFGAAGTEGVTFRTVKRTSSWAGPSVLTVIQNTNVYGTSADSKTEYGYRFVVTALAAGAVAYNLTAYANAEL